MSCHCDSIFLKSAASDFGRSCLSLVTSSLQPAHGRSAQWHALMPLCFMIYQMSRPGWPSIRQERVRWLLGYSPPWPLRQTAETSLYDLPVAVWQNQYCVQRRGGRRGPKGLQHFLVYCLVETSATAEQHTRIWANLCLHLWVVTWLSDTPDPSCLWRLSLLSRRWRRRRARLCTKVDAACGQILQVALGVTDEFLAHHCEAAFQIMMRSLFPIEPEEQTIENNSVESCRNERNIFRLHAGELPIWCHPRDFP